MGATPEEIKALVRRLEDAMNSRELDLLDDVVAEDFVRHCEATPDVEVHSREEFKEFLRQNTAAFPDNVQTFHQVIVEGDLAGIWVEYEGTQTGQFGPLPPSGRKARFDFGGYLRVENGKLAELWLTWDNMSILSQLGFLPAAPGEG
jgi:predicted ester cyclase